VPEDLVGRQPDRILDPFGFKVFVDARHGEGCIGPEIDARDLALVACDDRLDVVVYRVLRTTTRRDAYNFAGSRGDGQRKQVDDQSDSIEASSNNPVAHSRDLTCCFLRLANLDSGAFERLGRYETALWRQIVQILLALRNIRYR